MSHSRRTIEDVLKHHIRSAPKDAMEWDAARVLHQLRAQEKAFDRAERVQHREVIATSPRWRKFAVAGLVAALAVAAIIVVLDRRTLAVVESAHAARRTVGADTIVQAMGETTTVTLKDGSVVEMRANSELSLKPAADGVSIQLSEGTIIVRAAKQSAGHLYVRTRDVAVSVVGTVFLVGVEREGSRVGVIEGAVTVGQEASSRKLVAGEQTVTDPFLVPRSLNEEIAWSSHAVEYAALLQQTSAPVRFEVASIRSAPYQNRGPIGVMPTNKQLHAYHQPVQELILYAYGLKEFQLSGGPGWVYNRDIYGKDVYDIVANAETDFIPTEQQFRQMMQKLLGDRFKLSVRHSSQEFPGYALVIGAKGSKLKEMPRNIEISAGIWRAGEPESSFEAHGVPITRLLDVLKTASHRPVVDKTGLTSTYEFTLHYAETESETDPIPAGVPSIFAAVEEQLGLKLEPIKQRFETIEIDHVERPTEN